MSGERTGEGLGDMLARAKVQPFYTDKVDEYIYYREAIEPEVYSDTDTCKALVLAILDQAGMSVRGQNAVRKAMEESWRP